MKSILLAAALLLGVACEETGGGDVYDDASLPDDGEVSYTFPDSGPGGDVPPATTDQGGADAPPPKDDPRVFPGAWCSEFECELKLQDDGGWSCAPKAFWNATAEAVAMFCWPEGNDD